MASSSVRISGVEKDTAVGDTVYLVVNPDGPYGVEFEGDKNGCSLVIRAWKKMPNDKFGPIQKNGGIHLGDVVSHVNDVSLALIPYNDALLILNDRNLLKKGLSFISNREHYRRKAASLQGTTSATSSNSLEKNSFLSVVKRARVNEDNGKKFAEYEIACQWRVATMKVQKEMIYKWSVWRRFSDFEKVNSSLQKKLGWQMDGIEFPSAHTFVLYKLGVDFIDQRREDLNTYWQKILKLDKVSEFSKHHCSIELKEFLDVDKASSQEGSVPVDFIGEDVNNNGSNIPNRRGSTGTTNNNRNSNRRGSMKQTKSATGSNLFQENNSSVAVTTASQQKKPESTPVSTTSIQSAPTKQSEPTPPASTSDPKFAKFDKMKNMNLPEGAIRHKMNLEGFSQNEIDGYFGSNSVVSTSALNSPPSNSSDPKFEKYDKMKNMNLPEGAIRHKMNMDGFSQNEIDGYFGSNSAPLPTPPPTNKSVPPSSKPVVSKAEVPPTKPPAATGGRANLLGDIAKRRID